MSSTINVPPHSSLPVTPPVSKPLPSEVTVAKATLPEAKGPQKPSAPQPKTEDKKNIYAYEKAKQEFEQAKQVNPSAYKQYILPGTDFKVESAESKDGGLTRFETGTIVKEQAVGGPVTVTSPSGLVIASKLMNKGDVEAEAAEIDQYVDSLQLKKPTSDIHRMTEDQLTHNLAESEIWGLTMSDPDAVSINPSTENIDVNTSTGVFHLDKQDNIAFERADGKASLLLKPSFKEVPKANPEAATPVSDASKPHAPEAIAPAKASKVFNA
ncbi:MAG: hypothetical protein HEQ32_09035 [Vampirovibrio sp.]